MVYGGSSHSLYLGYDSGAITKIDMSIKLQEEPFSTTPSALHGLAMAGRFILAADRSHGNTHYVYASDGTFITSRNWYYYYSREYTWNVENNRIYFFQDDLSPNDINYEEIDQVSGMIVSVGQTPSHGHYDIQPPIRISKNGAMLLLGSGDIYDSNSLALVDALPISLVDAAWTEQGVITLRSASEGGTLLEQWDDEYTLFFQHNFEGRPLRIFESTEGFVVVTLRDGHPAFYRYLPSNDGDGDGVANEFDAFPLDPSASVDSDGDGYPDDWNPGKSKMDSTTELILDSFPFDSACQLPAHGFQDNPAVCDIASAIPNYTPDQIEIGIDGTIYLLSTMNQRIYRWSLYQNYHLNPIFIDGAANLMCYDQTRQVVYLGYANGTINQIDLNDETHEKHFATVNGSLHGLAMAGNYLFAADSDYYQNQGDYYLFALDGTLTTRKIYRNPPSLEYAWNNVTNRIYHFIYDQLSYEQIEPSTGMIVSNGYGPRDREPHPIRISNDMSKILIGSGNLYDSSSLSLLANTSIRMIDAAWMHIGIISLRPVSDEQTLLEQWDANYRLLNQVNFEGYPLRVFEWQGSYVIITLLNGQPTFFWYYPIW